MTQRDGIGREVGGGFRMGNTCTPMVDSPLGGTRRVGGLLGVAGRLSPGHLFEDNPFDEGTT